MLGRESARRDYSARVCHNIASIMANLNMKQNDAVTMYEGALSGIKIVEWGSSPHYQTSSNKVVILDTANCH